MTGNSMMGPILLRNVPLERIACPSCGRTPSRWARALAALRTQWISVVNVSFCDGGKPLSRPIEGIQAAMTGQTEVHYECAGVSEPHLHLSCKLCGFRSLMKTKAGSL